MSAKIIVSAVSIILVVGVAIGVVVGVHKTAKQMNDVEITPQTKAILNICSPTSYKELCMQTITSASNANMTDPKELIKASVNAIIDKVQHGGKLSDSLMASVNDPTVKSALDKCKSYFERASDSLELALSAVSDGDMKNISERAGLIQSWLNPVISYTVTCMDEMAESSAKQQILDHGANVTAIADNALAILGELPKVLAEFNIKLDLSAVNTGRRLLEEEAASGMDHTFPSWFSVSDRRLMARAPRGRGAAAPRLTPNAVVALDGSGQFKSVAAALNAYPRGIKGRYVVYVKAGVYREKIILTKEKVNVYLYGDGARRTIITNDKSVVRDKIGTSETATFAVEANGFIARDIGFTNTAGPDGEQAVALRVNGDMCAFFSVRIDGYQDSLYVQANKQFYRNCVISGTVDFIFGDSSTIIQNSLIIVRKGRKGNQNTVTAPGRQEFHETTTLVLQNCRIVPEQLLVPEKFVVKSYLGRPWKKFAASVIMESEIGDFIQPAGYLSWNGDQTGFFAEYNNRGPGADTSRRVNWKGFQRIRGGKAAQYTVDAYLNNGYPWVRYTGIRYIPGLSKPAQN